MQTEKRPRGRPKLPEGEVKERARVAARVALAKKMAALREDPVARAKFNEARARRVRLRYHIDAEYREKCKKARRDRYHAQKAAGQGPARPAEPE
jgi:hypothetical protein